MCFQREKEQFTHAPELAARHGFVLGKTCRVFNKKEAALI